MEELKRLLTEKMDKRSTLNVEIVNLQKALEMLEVEEKKRILKDN